MWNKNDSGVMPVIFAAMLTIMQLVGCVGIVDESVEHEIAAAREMVFDAMRDRIGALGEDRAFYCRKERWSWMSRSSDLQYECRDIDWIRFREVKPDDDPPDDGRFGDELIDLLRKCKMEVEGASHLKWVGNMLTTPMTSSATRSLRLQGQTWLPQ